MIRLKNILVATDFSEASGAALAYGRDLARGARDEEFIRRRQFFRTHDALLDSDAGHPARAKGMAVTIGRIRVEKTSLRFYLLAHNTIRGGAGGSVLNAELAYKEGVI